MYDKLTFYISEGAESETMKSMFYSISFLVECRFCKCLLISILVGFCSYLEFVFNVDSGLFG